MILKYITTIKCLAATIALLISYGSAEAQYKGTEIDGIIGKVNNYIVLKSDLERAYQEFLASGEQGAGDMKCQIFESLLINKLMVAKAEIDSIIVTDEEVDRELNQRMQMIVSQIGSEDKIEEYYGKTLNQLKEELRERMREQKVVQRMQATITEDVKVTPAEVQRFYNNIPQDSLPYFSTEVAVAQIVKIPEIGSSQKNTVSSQLLALRKRITEGDEDFETLAKEYSEEPGAKESGGNIGFWKRGELAPEYEAAALSMAPGEISQPVETQFGFHLIQLIERRGNTFNSRHILIRPSSSTVDVARTEQYLDSLRNLINIDSISFEQAAKKYSSDLQTSGSGGFFVDNTGAARISVEELDPVVFFAIDTMQVGNISKPMTFRMDDGTEAVRILYYKEKINPHQANLQEDYQKIYAATLNQKKGIVLENWFQEAREEVFINVDEAYNHCQLLQ